MTHKTYAVVIHTEQYAGNFHQQLCAYLTGASDHHVSEKEAGEFQKEVKNFKLSNHLYSFERASGCEMNSHMHATPGWSNDGNGNHFKDLLSTNPAFLSMVMFFSRKPTENELNIMTKRASDFAQKNNISFTGLELKSMNFSEAKRLAGQT